MVGKKKREKPSELFQNWLKKLLDGYGLKDQIHGARRRLVTVEVLNLKEKKEIGRGEEEEK